MASAIFEDSDQNVPQAGSTGSSSHVVKVKSLKTATEMSLFF